MLTPGEIDELSASVLKVFEELEQGIKHEAARFLRDPKPVDRATVRARLVAEATRREETVKRTIARVVTEAAERSLLEDEKIYEAARAAALIGPYTPVEGSRAIQALLARGVEDTTRLANLVGTRAVEASIPAVIDALDDAMVKLVTQQGAPEQVVREAAERIAAHATTFTYRTAEGRVVRTGLYEGARRAVLTGANQTVLRMQQERMKEVGARHVQISAHAGARPSHQEWQGMVIPYDQMEAVTGYGTGEGLGGWNCRHTFWPFIPGVMEPVDYSWIGDRETETRIYEATQRQRYAERQIRKYRARLASYDGAGLPSDDPAVVRTRDLVTKWRREASAAARKTGGLRRYERERPVLAAA